LNEHRRHFVEDGIWNHNNFSERATRFQLFHGFPYAGERKDSVDDRLQAPSVDQLHEVDEVFS
jgi:hypothetical protein